LEVGNVKDWFNFPNEEAEKKGLEGSLAFLNPKGLELKGLEGVNKGWFIDLFIKSSLILSKGLEVGKVKGWFTFPNEKPAVEGFLEGFLVEINILER
jgi:hypothetical protein